MANYTTYTVEFKESMVQKILANPDRSVRSISAEAAIPSSTLRNWILKYGHNKGSNVSKKKTHKLSPEEKFNIVLITASMSEAEKSEYCRKNGIYPEEIEQWKQDCISGCGAQLSSAAEKRAKNSERKWENETKRLKKEIKRKDKALAETAALLVLKKKAEAIWGDPEDD